MIHARDDGETFGLSIAEFSSMNKPIITYKPGPRKMWRYFKDNQLKKKLLKSAINTATKDSPQLNLQLILLKTKTLLKERNVFSQ